MMPAAGVEIRLAVEADRERIRTMLAQDIHASAYRATVPNLDGFDALFDRFVTGTDQTGLLVAAHGAVAHGFVAVLCHPHLLSSRVVALAVLWWVDPDHRGGADGLRLLAATEEWARAHAATALQIGGWSPPIASAYARLGYHPMEQIYQKELTNDA